MRTVVAVVAALAVDARAQPAPETTPEPAAPVDPAIEKVARIARSLARDGHCDVALEYGKTIETDAPTYYTQVFAADPSIAACIAGTARQAPLPTGPSPAPAVASGEPQSERDICRPARLYLEPSLFFANGSTYTDSAGGSQTTSNEGLFHRIAAGGLFRSCSRLPGVVGRLGATAVVNPVVSGFGVEAEADYGTGPVVRGGLRLGIELGWGSRIATAGARVRFFDTVFLGVDAYSARDVSYTSHGVMLGFGLEGRAGRIAVVTEAILFSIFFVVIVAGGGPD